MAKKHVVFVWVLVGVFFLRPLAVFAETASFQFVTRPQIVLVNTQSGQFIIQSQNTAGEKEAVSETYDILFHSSSPTGKFLSSSGKDITKTMAKGTYSRTFYYKDSSLGTSTLTVSATGRVTKKNFSLSQDIVVVSVLPKVEPVVKIVSKPVSKVAVTRATPAKEKIKNSTQDRDLTATVISTENEKKVPEDGVLYVASHKTSLFDSLIDLPNNFWKWITSLF